MGHKVSGGNPKFWSARENCKETRSDRHSWSSTCLRAPESRNDRSGETDKETAKVRRGELLLRTKHDSSHFSEPFMFPNDLDFGCFGVRHIKVVSPRINHTQVGTPHNRQNFYFCKNLGTSETLGRQSHSANQNTLKSHHLVITSAPKQGVTEQELVTVLRDKKKTNHVNEARCFFDLLVSLTRRSNIQKFLSCKSKNKL